MTISSVEYGHDMLGNDIVIGDMVSYINEPCLPKPQIGVVVKLIFNKETPVVLQVEDIYNHCITNHYVEQVAKVLQPETFRWPTPAGT